jgi:Protein of unknown function (DUF4199)
MKNAVLKFGLISGVALAGAARALMQLCLRGVIDIANAHFIGYSIMVVSFIPVFLGIHACREENGGTIGFWRAFGIGMLITAVATLCYVVAWKIVYYGGFVPGFEEKMIAAQVEKMQQDGAAGAEIAAARQQMQRMWQVYRNPQINAAITFLEPLPVALIISAVAAGILRRKPDRRGSPAAAMA